jgi:predicted metal-binding membrane protein
MGSTSPLAAPTPTPTAAMAAALTATLGLAAVAWVITVRRMAGMDMGVATPLGPFASFIAVWTAMMAAMMLPGAVPAALQSARAGGRVRDALLFVGSYMVVWAFVGVAVFALYRPHTTLAAGVVTIAAGVYELTPLKQIFRRRCRETAGSGFEFGLYCLGSNLGLMLVLMALGMMSLTWMTIAAVLMVAQKLLPARAVIDAPVGLTIVGFGVLILIAPMAVPGLTPSM